VLRHVADRQAGNDLHGRVPHQTFSRLRDSNPRASWLTDTTRIARMRVSLPTGSTLTMSSLQMPNPARLPM
jgi:hypothetical protein